MSDFYEGIEGIAYEVLTQFGKQVTLVRTIPLDPAVWTKVSTRGPTGVVTTWHNSVTGLDSAVDPSEIRVYNGVGVEGSYKTQYNPALVIEASDIRLYAMRIPKPLPGDVIRMSSQSFVVKTAQPVRPAETTILYDIQLKG